MLRWMLSIKSLLLMPALGLWFCGQKEERRLMVPLHLSILLAMEIPSLFCVPQQRIGM